MKRYVLAVSVRPDESELFYPVVCQTLFGTELEAKRYFQTTMLGQIVRMILTDHDVVIGEDISEREVNEIVSRTGIVKNSCDVCEEVGDLYFESEIKFSIEAVDV